MIKKLKIFISIASYKDKLLENTIKEAIDKASYPERLVFGIVEQQDEDEALNRNLFPNNTIRYIRINPEDSRGACWARSVAMNFYSNETFFMQIDSHMLFDKGWDEYLIEYLFVCQMENQNCILSGYPHPFHIKEGVPTPEIITPNILTDVLTEDTKFTEHSLSLAFRAFAIDVKEPVLGFHAAGGFIFAPGKFVEIFPYDYQIYFHGEEQLLAAKLFTNGWDIFHIPGLPIYHLYETAENPTRPKHWDKDENEKRREHWHSLHKRSDERLKEILLGEKDFGVFSLGNKRSMKEYAEKFGIDYQNRIILNKARNIK